MPESEELVESAKLEEGAKLEENAELEELEERSLESKLWRLNFGRVCQKVGSSFALIGHFC